MADKRLQDFTAKPIPGPSDLLYGADSSNSFNEVKFTVDQMISSYGAALKSIANLVTSSNQILVTTAPNTYTTTSLTPYAATLIAALNASDARAILGVTPGSDVQPYSIALTSIAGLTTAPDLMIYTTASNVYATTGFTAYARTLLDDVNASAMQATLLLVPGTNVQTQNPALQSIADLITASDQMLYTTGSNAYATSDLTPYARTLLDDSTATMARNTLGVVIGTNVEAWDAGLDSIAGLTTSANKMIYTTGSDVYATTDLTPFARTILDDNDGNALTTTIGAVHLTGDTMTGPILYASTPFNNNELVNKAYVDAAVISIKPPVVASTTADLSGYTYDNGSAGVGATLTAGSNGVFSLADGYAVSVNDRILVPFQNNQYQNGVYVVTQIGDLTNPTILTRSAGYDQTSEIKAGDRWTVLNGNLYASTEWLQTSNVSVVGTSPINFGLVGSAYLAKSANLSDLPSASAARSNLGLAIGTNVEAFDAGLNSIAGLTTAADKMIYTTANDIYTTTNLSPFARTILGNTTAAAVTTTIGALPLAGGTMTGSLILAADPTTTLQASTKNYVDANLVNLNMIKAGNFQINPWQRGVSFAGLGTTKTYTADRFFADFNNSTAVRTDSKASGTNGVNQTGVYSPTYYGIQITTDQQVIAADTYNTFGTTIEGYDWNEGFAAPIVLSFSVICSKPGIYCVALRSGALDKSYVAEYTVNTANVVEYKKIPIATNLGVGGAWSVSTGLGLRIDFVLAAGSNYITAPNTWITGNYLATANQVNGLDNINNNFKFDLIKLERGTVATPYHVDSYDNVLRHCQRYFEKSYSPTVIPGTVTNVGYYRQDQSYISVTLGSTPDRFLVQKCTIPTITIYNPVSGASGSVQKFSPATAFPVSVSTTSQISIGLINTVTGSFDASSVYSYHWTALAEL